MEINQGVVDVDGLVTSVTASSPLASSGGTTPNISLTGVVPVANGGTGTGTAFTQGSVIFVGAAGVYAQDNANFFWDDTNNRLGIGTATPSAPVDLLKTGLGATPSDVSGALIMNTTAAAAGAQQVSPSITLEGQGWKTTATAASQAVRFQNYVLPVQGTTAPTGTWSLAASINGGAYANLVEVNSSTGMLLRNTGNSTVALNWAGSDRSGSLNFNGGLIQLIGGATGAAYQSTKDTAGGGLQRFGAFNGNLVTTFFTLFDDNASNVMAQRNGTNAQVLRVYNTSASSNANYERGVLDWQASSNKFTVGTQAGGTGTLRELVLTGSVITAAVDVNVPDEAYGSAWDGSLEVPTKNAVYDKIQTIATDVLFDHFTDANNGTTVETDLYSDTLAAAQLSVNGEKIVAQYGGVFVGDATSTQQLKAYFGGTVIFDSGALGVGVGTTNWDLYITIIRVSSSVVRCSATLNTSFASLSAYAKYTEVTGLTLANTQVLKITGTAAGVSGASNQITAKEGYVEFKPAA